MLANLFRVTLFLSATNIFVLEPMLARSVLPRLGGAAAVWNACVLFYQTALLAGYALAHFGPRLLGVRRHALVHMVLLVAGLAFLPPLVRGTPRASSEPSLWLFGRLFVDVGLPFVLLAATAPLLQIWYSRSGRADARDPYPLYAASNLGSFVALIAYPFVIEPSLGLRGQAWAATGGYVAFVLLVAACAAAVFRASAHSPGPPGDARVQGTDDAPALLPDSAPSWQARWRWLLLSAVPASLSLGVTTHLTIDIAPVPLLWVAPLAIYLLTFVLAFARRQRISKKWMLRIQPFFVVGLIVESVLVSEGRAMWILPVHLGLLFTCAFVAHRELAESRPAAAHLGEFFLWVSLGGVLGGVFNALVAPAVFTGHTEYPLAIAAAVLCRPRPAASTARARRFDVFAPLLMADGLAFALLAVAAFRNLHEYTIYVVVGAAGVVAFSFVERRVRFALALGALVVVGIFWSPRKDVIEQRRSFYGVQRVLLGSDGVARLQHGSTLHGLQFTQAGARRVPRGYYHQNSPVGRVMSALAGRGGSRVGLVGLGAGTLAAYARMGDRFTFYEIDLSVVDLASGGHIFTYVSDAAGSVDIVLGDGRKSLERTADDSFDLIVLDAFSSDAVPTHLLTTEAIQLYFRKLSRDGVLLVHTSNRYLRLEQVLAATAARLKLVSWLGWQYPDQAGKWQGHYSSEWVLIARRPEDLPNMGDMPLFEPLKPTEGRRAWTDDFSSLLGIVKLKLR